MPEISVVDIIQQTISKLWECGEKVSITMFQGGEKLDSMGGDRFDRTGK